MFRNRQMTRAVRRSYCGCEVAIRWILAAFFEGKRLVALQATQQPLQVALAGRGLGTRR